MEVKILDQDIYVNIIDDDTIEASIVGRTVTGSGTAATQAEVNTGTDTDKFVSPKTFNDSAQLAAKQATLVSATNIKTINGNSLLGGGDLVVTGGGVSGLTATRVPFAQDATTLVDSSLLTFDSSTSKLLVGLATIRSTNPSGSGANLFIGTTAGRDAATGYYNIAIGNSVMTALTSGYRNIAIGHDALISAQGTQYNIAIGEGAIALCVSAGENIGIGYHSLYRALGEDNIGIGFSPGSRLSGTGRDNIFLGYYAGAQKDAYGTNEYSNGDHSIFIGAYTYAPNATESCQINIGGVFFSRNNTNANPPPDEQTGDVGICIANPTARFHIPASSTSKASLRIPHGAAPSSPYDGDIWTDTSAMYVRINGVTKTIAFV